MCGVFHISESMQQKILQGIRNEIRDGMDEWNRDIHPMDFAPVITANTANSVSAANTANSQGRQLKTQVQTQVKTQVQTQMQTQMQTQAHLQLRQMRWGFPGIGTGGGRTETIGERTRTGVIFNARQESVLDKKLFQASILNRRAVIPADHFYEWNENREKYTFRRTDEEVMYLAGFYDLQENEDRFVILTTQANESMRPVHDRMPVILEENQLEDWIYDERRALDILRQAPVLLDRSTPYEQMSLFELN